MKLSPELKLFIKEHESDDVHTLAIQAKRYPQIDIQRAIQQITGKKISKDKIPGWYSNDELIYPKHISLEQCSSESTARFKATLCNGDTMADLTGGFGIDFSFLASQYKHATYVEQQTELVDIATHNFEILGLNNTQVIQADAIDYLTNMQPVDMVYIDPARRSTEGKKTVRIEDCTPNILEIENLLEQKAKRTMIKLSPMLDISLALKSLKDISDVYVISVNNECKELLFIKQKADNNTKLHCINIHKEGTDQFSFTKNEEEQTNISYTDQLGKYLYEPNASILKAGAYKSIAQHFGVNKLHLSSHLYTSDVLHADFHGRRFRVENVCTLASKDIKEQLSPLKQANIATRNFPLSVNEIRQKTKLKEGGDTYIFATTLATDKKVMVICKKI